MEKIFINTDGGSRGNPGPGAIGIVFFDSDNKIIYKHQECIGRATNNEAEYKAIIKALELLIKSKWFLANNLAEKEVVCRLDSKLVVEQICGRWKIKQDHLREFIVQINNLTNKIKLKISFVHIPREENSEADRHVNEALDATN